MAAKTIFLFALSFALLLAGISHADVIMPGTHTIPTCWKITNAADFPDIVLIGETVPISSPSNANASLVPIKSDECISASGSHYKFDGYNVYWASKSYIDSIGGIQNIKRSYVEKDGEFIGSVKSFLVHDGNVHLLSTEIRPSAQYSVNDSSPSQKHYYNYKLEPNRCGGSRCEGYSLVKVGEFDEVAEPHPIACTEEAKVCKDGSTVSRTGPNCEFAPCPGEEMPPAPPGDKDSDHSSGPDPMPPKSFVDQIMCFFASLFGGKC